MAWTVNPTADELQLLAECGVVLREAGRYGEAREVFQGLCELRGQSATPYVELAKTYMQEGDLAGAEKQFRRALTVEPQNAHAWASLMELAFFKKDSTGVRTNAQKAMELDPAGPSGEFARTFVAEAERLSLL